MIVLGQLLIFGLAFAGVTASSIGLIYFAGRAVNRAQARDNRWRYGAIAALCLCGIVASAALGFVGIGAIMYLAQR
ncbi:hypothetical protein U91I_02275 [alpha proteobacterium U9-1i]|nr:hypothetical protein U91I_02275 [alpha proteobacterium U9-1i]